ncbi:hypothetical protein AAGS61_04610 [Lysinibacillus sp. KU-BSD001]|uniref:hypothetical protein n=1 Tax=Lysinibacillus sp. KU-BSD001 TaxID=3141328 RepID=UPI0036E3E05B
MTMAHPYKQIYGSYEVPKEIHQLHALEQELNREDLSLEMIGLQPLHDWFTYPITPPDLIPFAHTGGAGIHFGFLTDFGLTKDLQDAPIVCVSPTNDPPIKYMARNIGQFFNLASSVPHVEMLDDFWAYDDATQIQAHIEEFYKDTPNDWAKKRQAVFTRFQATFGTQQEQVIPYFQKVQLERKNRQSLFTLDGLGVIGENASAEGKSYAFDSHHSLNEQELQRMQDFLKQASHLEKLAFIRDAHYRYVVAPNYDEAVLQIIIELLQSMDLQAELQRVLARE